MGSTRPLRVRPSPAQHAALLFTRTPNARRQRLCGCHDCQWRHTCLTCASAPTHLQQQLKPLVTRWQELVTAHSISVVPVHRCSNARMRTGVWGSKRSTETGCVPSLGCDIAGIRRGGGASGSPKEAGGGSKRSAHAAAPPAGKRHGCRRVGGQLRSCSTRLRLFVKTLTFGQRGGDLS